MKIFELITGICVLVFDIFAAINQFKKVADIFAEVNKG